MFFLLMVCVLRTFQSTLLGLEEAQVAGLLWYTSISSQASSGFINKSLSSHQPDLDQFETPLKTTLPPITLVTLFLATLTVLPLISVCQLYLATSGHSSLGDEQPR